MIRRHRAKATALVMGLQNRTVAFLLPIRNFLSLRFSRSGKIENVISISHCFRVQSWKTSPRYLRLALIGCVGLLLGTSSFAAADGAAADWLGQARAAFEQGRREQALSLVQKAIEADPNNQDAHYFSARLHERLQQHERAIEDYNQLLRLKPGAANIYLLRGSEYFRLGKIKESVADFDKEIELEPARAPQHWQRGISYYYAGRFEDGRKQFDLHQTVNSSDVENAVWHFLCVARSASVAKARTALIPIQGDRRVPMMQVYALFAGKGTVDAVLAAATVGEPPPAELRQRLFYAHLYLGLYFEALGETKRAAEHIDRAAGEFAVDHYMGDVARVHQKLRRETPAKN